MLLGSLNTLSSLCQVGRANQSELPQGVRLALTYGGSGERVAMRTAAIKQPTEKMRNKTRRRGTGAILSRRKGYWTRCS